MISKKYLVQFILSLVVAFALVLTTVNTFPRVASAENASNTALEALGTEIEFYQQGDLANAESSYHEATGRAKAEVEVFIATKQSLSEIKASQGNLEKTERLAIEADNAIKLSEINPLEQQCGECKGADGVKVNCAEPAQMIQNGMLIKYCRPCSCKICNSCGDPR